VRTSKDREAFASRQWIPRLRQREINVARQIALISAGLPKSTNWSQSFTVIGVAAIRPADDIVMICATHWNRAHPEPLQLNKIGVSVGEMADA
jgi:hypothetical protein